MAVIVTFGVFLLAVFATAQQQDVNQCGRHRSARISGGVAAGAGEYPAVAGLWMNSKNMIVCGATIVAPRYVVTAAHCLQNQFNPQLADVKVQVGLIDYRNAAASPYARSHDVERFLAHPSYNSQTGVADVGLVRTTVAIQYNVAVGPACLPYGTDLFAGRYVDMLGWGRTTVGSQTPANVLQRARVSVITNAACASHWGSYIQPEHLCTHTQGRGSCMNDSGGPVFEDTNGYLTLIGIINFVGGCTVENKPGGAARVSVWSRWIYENTRA